MDSNVKALIITNFCAIVLFLTKEVFSFFRSGVRDHLKSTSELSKLVSRLEVQVEYLEKHIGAIPRLQKDINEAHRALRKLKGDERAGDECLTREA